MYGDDVPPDMAHLANEVTPCRCSPGARCQACRDLTDRDVAEMMRQDRESEGMTRRTAQDWESFVVECAAELLEQVKRP